MPDPSAPWEPESLRLRVGDRVRVRLSGEEPESIGWHTRWADGAVGTVRLIYRSGETTHRYAVDLDRPGGGRLFARAELDRLP